MHPDISKWTVIDVGDWLRAKGFQELVKFFADNEMNGRTLMCLDSPTLFHLSSLYPQVFKVGPLIMLRAHLEILQGKRVVEPTSTGGFQLHGVDARKFFAPNFEQRASSSVGPSNQNNNVHEIGHGFGDGGDQQSIPQDNELLATGDGGEPMDEQEHGDDADGSGSNIEASQEVNEGECRVDSAVKQHRAASVNDSDVVDWSNVPVRVDGNKSHVIAQLQTPISDGISFRSADMSASSNASAAVAVVPNLPNEAPLIINEAGNQMATAAAPSTPPLESQPIDQGGPHTLPSISPRPTPPIPPTGIVYLGRTDMNRPSTKWQHQQHRSTNTQLSQMRLPVQQSMTAAAATSSKSQAFAGGLKATPQTSAAAYNPVLTRNRSQSMVSNQGSTSRQHGSNDNAVAQGQQQFQPRQRSQLNQGGYMYAYPSNVSSPVPKVGEMFRGYVCLAESPLRLNIFVETSYERVQRMLKEMNEFYNNDPYVLPLAADRLQKGAACAAKFDDIWYRAIIEEIIDKDRVKILFVDYGNMEIVRRRDLMALKYSKAIECPPQRIEARLAGLPEDTEIPGEIRQAFLEMVDPGKKLFLMDFESYEGDRWPITLIDSVTNQSINYHLACKLGLQQTEPTPPPNMIRRQSAGVSTGKDIWDEMLGDDAYDDED